MADGASRETALESSRDVGELVLATIAACTDAGAPTLTIDGGDGTPLPATALCAIGAGDVGRRVAVMFAGGDPARPVVLGLFREAPAAVVEADGAPVRIEAEREIVLTCGKASLRMTADGRITLRGTRIVSHASGANRIRGGSVHLN